jgi:N6-L-threonylcarbamoyladenine synthase
MHVNVLAIESSCDESSVAIAKDGEIVSLRTVTQSVHREFGGVVPELAGRSHLQLVDRLTDEASAEAGIVLNQIDLVAATSGPGLIGSLLVGVNYARGLAVALGKPFRSVHHLEAHLWSAEIEYGALPLPFLILLVSGGHTLIIQVEGLRHYTVLGTTVDDALGEAYDKVGKLFGLGFPAGAEVDKIAAQGNSRRFALTSPKMDDSLDFSFSGLKTAVLYCIRGLGVDQAHAHAPDVLAAFQEAALASASSKMRRAAEITSPRAIVAAGGVAANTRLRQLLVAIARDFAIPCVFPPLRYCMDNAAMIAYLATKLERADIEDPVVPARPRWPLEELSTETQPA